MQRAGRIGRNELDDHLALGVQRLHAVAGARVQHLAHGFLFGSGFEADVDKTGAGNFNGIDPSLESRSL